MTRRVFMLESNPRHDVSSAKTYGQLVGIFRSDEKQPSVWSQHFAEVIMSRLAAERFDQFADYLLVAGPQVPIVLFVGHVVAAYENVNLLLFDSVNCEYVHKTIT